MIATVVLLAASFAAALFLWSSARARAAALSARATELVRSREECAVEAGRLREELRAASDGRSRLEASIAAERATAEARLAAAEDARRKLEDTFDALSRKALQANNEQFLQLARESLQGLSQAARGDLEKRQQAIGELMRPVRETLDKVDGKLQQLEVARRGAYVQLETQVRSLLETQNALRAETGNLVKALRAPAVRGRWGEIQLQRVVEMAGMVEHCDFAQQETLQGDEQRLRPDVVVKLPGGKRLVVDAKAPLAAYLDAIEAKTEDERRAHLATHAQQLRRHIEQLSRKAYWDQFLQTPEFVVLFVPNEAVFAAAMEQDPTLMESAVSEKVLLASPTTLIALLRAAAFGWRQEGLARDAQEIASLGRDLHKRLGDMAGHFARVGKGLRGAVDAYNSAVGSMETRVLVSARRLKEKVAPNEEDMEPLPAVEVRPRALQAPEFVPPSLPEDAN